jgi:hypothetical protein
VITRRTSRPGCEEDRGPSRCPKPKPEAPRRLDDTGYWVSDALSDVYTFGNAPDDGSMAGTHLKVRSSRRVGRRRVNGRTWSVLSYAS